MGAWKSSRRSCGKGGEPLLWVLEGLGAASGVSSKPELGRGGSGGNRAGLRRVPEGTDHWRKYVAYTTD